jgi:3-hydroxy acid dehydrogenase / malonic semialdehyde reductase
MQVNDSCALITGASSGIGATLADLMIEQGYRVIGTARDISRLDHLRQAHGDRFHAVAMDVNQSQSVNNLIDALPDNWRNIDVLVNNAGHDVGGRVRFSEGNLEQWLDIIETNVRGLMRTTYALLPGMLERNCGHIVNIGSVAGVESAPTVAAYSSSKHAVNGFSESLRKELEKTAVRVSQILPGMVRTGFAGARFGDSEKGQQFYDDFGMWLNPEDIANAVMYVLEQPANVVVSQLVILPKPLL